MTKGWLSAEVRTRWVVLGIVVVPRETVKQTKNNNHGDWICWLGGHVIEKV